MDFKVRTGPYKVKRRRHLNNSSWYSEHYNVLTSLTLEIQLCYFKFSLNSPRREGRSDIDRTHLTAWMLLKQCIRSLLWCSPKCHRTMRCQTKKKSDVGKSVCSLNAEYEVTMQTLCRNCCSPALQWTEVVQARTVCLPRIITIQLSLCYSME